MADPYTKGQESITQAEHISPAKTGDNIDAKRVANYNWNGSSWERQSVTGGLLQGVSYDEIVFSNEDANSNPQTATVKLDSATVATLTMSYNSESKLTHITRTS